MTVYGGVVHSFTDKDAGHLGRPEFARYDANADRRSWNQMREMLQEAFG
jgi:dienelactone hydrolase